MDGIRSSLSNPDVLSLTYPVLSPGPKPLAIFSGQTGPRDGLFHSSGHGPDHCISQLWLPQAPLGVQDQGSHPCHGSQSSSRTWSDPTGPLGALASPLTSQSGQIGNLQIVRNYCPTGRILANEGRHPQINGFLFLPRWIVFSCCGSIWLLWKAPVSNPCLACLERWCQLSIAPPSTCSLDFST